MGVPENARVSLKKPSKKNIARRRTIYKIKLKLRKLMEKIPAIIPSARSSNDPAAPAETAKARNNASTQRRRRRAKANAETAKIHFDVVGRLQ